MRPGHDRAAKLPRLGRPRRRRAIVDRLQKEFGREAQLQFGKHDEWWFAAAHRDYVAASGLAIDLETLQHEKRSDSRVESCSRKEQAAIVPSLKAPLQRR